MNNFGFVYLFGCVAGVLPCWGGGPKKSSSYSVIKDGGDAQLDKLECRKLIHNTFKSTPELLSHGHLMMFGAKLLEERYTCDAKIQILMQAAQRQESARMMATADAQLTSKIHIGVHWDIDHVHFLPLEKSFNKNRKKDSFSIGVLGFNGAYQTALLARKLWLEANKVIVRTMSHAEGGVGHEVEYGLSIDCAAVFVYYNVLTVRGYLKPKYFGYGTIHSQRILLSAYPKKVGMRILALTVLIGTGLIKVEPYPSPPQSVLGCLIVSLTEDLFLRDKPKDPSWERSLLKGCHNADKITEEKLTKLDTTLDGLYYLAVKHKEAVRSYVLDKPPVQNA